MAARKPKPRYQAKSNISANGVSLEGLVYVDHGPCTASGGKSPIKGDMTHRLLRIEEPRALKARGLNPTAWKEKPVTAGSLTAFYTLLPS
jgi:hypothetical protein